MKFSTTVSSEVGIPKIQDDSTIIFPPVHIVKLEAYKTIQFNTCVSISSVEEKGKIKVSIVDKYKPIVSVSHNVINPINNKNEIVLNITNKTSKFVRIEKEELLFVFSHIGMSQKPQEPTSEESKSEEPTSEESKSEELTSEESKSEELTSEEPKSEELTSEEPKSEELTSEEPKTEEPKAEESKSEEPKSEEPKSEEPKKKKATRTTKTTKTTKTSKKIVVK